MLNQFSRTSLIYGEDAVNKLKNARVAVFGLGGVGGYVCEALARSGVGALDLIDNDKISLTNLNRQILALHSTIGEYKCDVAQKRVKDINPECRVKTYKTFFLPETSGEFDFSGYDYIVDCIDTVTAKLALVECAEKAGKPIISAMGTGNKTDPSAFEVADIKDTSICPLCRIMRKELKKRGIDSLKVVYSKEEPAKPDREAVLHCMKENPSSTRRDVPGSTAFVPAAAGFVIAGEVINNIIDK